jgi:hypothetical protein
MLRLVLLLLYLAASFAVSGRTDGGGGLDPNGLTVQPPTTDSGGGLDPNGLTVQPPTTDSGGGWDPNG